MSCAKIGSSAVADEKNVAKKSSSIVDRIMGERKTKRSPWRAAFNDISLLECSVERSVFGTSRIIASATITTRNDSALMMYAQPTFATAMIKPAAAGPQTDAA